MLNFNIEIHPIKWLYYNLEADGEKAVAIIASSYNVRENKLSQLNSRLILSFDDIPQSNQLTSFNKTLAKDIHSFVDNLPADMDILYVCCDSGESRSSAMAAAIMRYFGEDDMQIWKNPHYHPNPLVYNLLCEEFGIVLADSETEGKVAINKKAFSDAIAASRKDDTP